MTLDDLFVVCAYVGKTEIFDDNGLKVEVDRLSQIIFDLDHPYHNLVNREVAYFDTHPDNNITRHKLVIKLEKEN